MILIVETKCFPFDPKICLPREMPKIPIALHPENESDSYGAVRVTYLKN